MSTEAVLAAVDGDVTHVLPSAPAARMASRALQELPAGCAAFLDGGALTLTVVAALPLDTVLTVVTNAVAIASMLAGHSHVEVLLLGGWLDGATASSVQTRCTDLPKEIHVDVAILSATGVSVQRGLSTRHVNEAELKRTMVRCAERTVALVDYSGVGTDSLVNFATLRDIDTLIVGGVPAVVDRGALAGIGARAVYV